MSYGVSCGLVCVGLLGRDCLLLFTLVLCLSFNEFVCVVGCFCYLLLGCLFGCMNACLLVLCWSVVVLWCLRCGIVVISCIWCVAD